MWDWQNTLTFAIVATAISFLLMRGLRTLQGKRAGCGTGCSTCTSESTKDSTAAKGWVPLESLTENRRD